MRWAGVVLAGGWLVRRYPRRGRGPRPAGAIDRAVIETSLTAGDGAAVTFDRLDLASCRVWISITNKTYRRWRGSCSSASSRRKNWPAGTPGGPGG